MKIKGNVRLFGKLAATVIKISRHLPELDRLRKAGDTAGEKALLARLETKWVNDVMNVYDLHFDISGRENIPEDPFVVIANHQAYFDIMAVFKAFEGHQIGFIAKKEFEKVPFLGRWILAIRGFFISHGDTRAALKTINDGVTILKNGYNLVIFPEGRRSHSHSMNEFKAGSFKLATRARVPIIPVTIDGTYKTFEEHDRLTKGVHATVIIHPAIATAGLDRAAQAGLPDKVERLIRQSLEDQGRIAYRQ